MAAQITFRNTARSAIVDYMEAKAAKSAAEAREKECKAKLKSLFAELGMMFKTNGITDYIIGFVQVQGKPKAVVYKETTAKGTVDWQAYALALGGTAEGAEAYRKPGSVRTSIEWASEKQMKSISNLSDT